MPSAIITVMQGPLCGTLATMFLYGVICMQVFHYASNYGSSDRHAIKWLVSRAPLVQVSTIWLIRCASGVGCGYIVCQALDFAAFSHVLIKRRSCTYHRFLESIHTAFSIHFIEWYLILHFDDPETLGYEVW